MNSPFRMSRKARFRPLGLIVCVLIGLVAAQPILVARRLPQGHDALFHLHRLIQIDTLLRQGILFSRWAPDLARGFGYPLFNYYGPLSYYVPEALHLLGMPFVPALLGAFVLLLVLAALTMYAWAHDLLGERAAILAAAAYVLSPYLVLNLVTRSVLAEVFALALLPLVLFSANRFVATNRPGYAVLMSLSLAAVILGHNVTAVLFLPFLVAYIAMAAVVARHAGKPHKQALAPAIGAYLAVLAALGLTAFFWLPALAERSLVQMNRLTAWSLFDYRLNFQTLATTFSLPVIEDLHLLNRPISCSLSLVAAILAAVGILGIWRWRPSQAQVAQLGFAALGACAALFMVLPHSRQVWAAFPQMHILQFPWRFLGIANLFLALLASAALRAIEGRAGRPRAATAIALPLVVGTLFVWVFAWQSVPLFHAQNDWTIDDVVRFERETQSVGTTTTGEYLPLTATEYPPPEQNTSYDRVLLDETSIPEDAQVVHAHYRPLEYVLTFEAPRPFVAVFNTLHFAGWRAWVDGAEAPITPTDPHGLISVPVPSGRHELRIRFGTTPIRTLGSAISLVSAGGLLGVVGLNLVRRRRRSPVFSEKARAEATQAGRVADPRTRATPGTDTALPRTSGLRSHDRSSLSPCLGWAVIGTLVLLFGAKTLLVDPLWAGYRRTRFDVVSGASFAGQLVLIGADRAAMVRSGEQAIITLYWRVPAWTSAEYSTTVCLVDERGLLVAQVDNQHPGNVPTNFWADTDYVRDRHYFSIPAGTPPGRYMLRVGAYPYGKPDETLSVLNVNGAPMGRSVDLMPLEVGRPKRPPRRGELAIPKRLDRPLAANLTLLGYDLPQRQIKTGEKLPFTLFWKAAGSLDAGHKVPLQLVDSSGEIAHRQDVSPVPGYDTGQWQTGDLWRGVQSLTIPPRLSGSYTLTVAQPGQPGVPLATLEVVAPTHVLTPPPVAHSERATFGDLASIVGYDVAGEVRPGQEVTVTVAWRVDGETTEPYKAFVHLLDPDGRLLAGSDTVPGNWQRPSPSWVEGEYITDPHSLQLPEDLKAGAYRLEVGLYNSDTLSRLQLPDGKDALILSQSLEVEP